MVALPELPEYNQRNVAPRAHARANKIIAHRYKLDDNGTGSRQAHSRTSSPRNRLQKSFIETTGIARADWDGSNAREHLLECRRSPGTARTNARPEGANRNRGPRQHR